MNSLETIRQTLASTVQTLHNVAYSAIPVIWPNFMTVDLENLSGPLVTVEIRMVNESELFGVGDDPTNMIIKGDLVISYLRALGTGLTGAAAYGDMLMAGLCNKKISGITYFGLTQVNISPYPGLVGVLNRIAFCV